MSTALTQLQFDGPVAYLTLDRPERHNSLVPALLDGLLENLKTVAARPATAALVLRATGRSFSTGGDVHGFYTIPREHRATYAEKLVGDLNRAILALLDLPVPVIGRVQGPVTGGSLGFLLACDLTVMAQEAFIQPYYTQMGFSPDGGWTALLPDRIGTAKAREIQLLNRRLSAAEAGQLGIVSTVTAADALDAIIDGWLAALLDKRPNALKLTKRMLLSSERRAAIAAALEAERQAFVEQIGSQEADSGMARFLAKSV